MSVYHYLYDVTLLTGDLEHSIYIYIDMFNVNARLQNIRYKTDYSIFVYDHIYSRYNKTA